MALADMGLMTKVLLAVATALVLVVAIGGYKILKIFGLIQLGPYEHEAPTIPLLQKPAILVLSKANGFVHTEALAAGEVMLKDIAEQNGWSIYATNNAATHNADDLAKFDVVIWNNVSGDVLTKDQRADFQAWLEQGGGWVGLHASGGDLNYKWDWYRDTLLGAQFKGHTKAPQFQDAKLLVTDASDYMTSHLPAVWQVPKEEWYAFKQNPRAKGSEILLTVDEGSYVTKSADGFFADSMDGEHPIVWRHSVGQGRALYSAIGHRAPAYEMAAYRQLIRHSIEWAGSMPRSEPKEFIE